LSLVLPGSFLYSLTFSFSGQLSMAYAAAVFTDSLLRAIKGEKGVVQPTFVKSPHFESQGLEYFASNVELGVSPSSFLCTPCSIRSLIVCVLCFPCI
jgi:hypothetical protein